MRNPARAFAIAFLLLGLSTTPTRAQPPPRAKRVLLISCDGLRPDAIEAAGATVLLDLIAGGSYQATAVDEIPPVTLPNHASMVTGLSVLHHGVVLNTDLPGRIAATTIFDTAFDAGLRVGFFINKTKLFYLCDVERVAAWMHTTDIDSLADSAAQAIRDDDLQLIFVHFKEPDGAGHAEGWMTEPYFDAVRRVDAAIGACLDALTDAGMQNETLVIISSDHGGHGQTHFLDIPEDRLIPFIINGPGIAPGRKLCAQVRIMDAAATALAVLGLPTNCAADGQVLAEALTESEQTDCQAPLPPVGFLCGGLPVFGFAALIGLLVTRERRRKRAVRGRTLGSCWRLGLPSAQYSS